MRSNQRQPCSSSFGNQYTEPSVWPPVKPTQMTNRFFHSLIALLLLHFSAHSQITGEDISAGKSYTLTSEIFETSRQLMVSLPDNYDTKGAGYDVLYLLDGQQWFLEALSQRNVLNHYEYVPGLIIVGIVTEDAPRYGFFAKSQKLINHLEKEIVPYIDTHFHTSGNRILFGWQFASAFTLRLMAQQPDLFNGWFTASPFPIQGPVIEGVKESLESGTLNSSTLVFATSLNENSVEPGAQELAELLNEKAPESLNWHYAKLKHETEVSAGHRTTPIGTLYQGLRSYYADYPHLEFNNLEDYNEAGGFDYVTNYYQQRGEKYGLPTGVTEEGMFFLVRMAMDADHFPTFSQLMDEFKDSDFLSGLNLGWNSRYAEFYLKHNSPDGAVTIYESLTQRFPENARPLAGLGAAYVAKSDLQKAKGYYQQAIDLAQKNGDRQLDRYKEALEKLKQP